MWGDDQGSSPKGLRVGYRGWKIHWLRPKSPIWSPWWPWGVLGHLGPGWANAPGKCTVPTSLCQWPRANCPTKTTP